MAKRLPAVSAEKDGGGEDAGKDNRAQGSVAEGPNVVPKSPGNGDPLGYRECVERDHCDDPGKRSPGPAPGRNVKNCHSQVCASDVAEDLRIMKIDPGNRSTGCAGAENCEHESNDHEAKDPQPRMQCGVAPRLKINIEEKRRAGEGKNLPTVKD